MTLQGIILVLLSAGCHASWNLLSKAKRVEPLSFLTRAQMFSATIYFPLFALMQSVVHYNTTMLVCVVSSGMCLGIYMVCLARAYHHGHVSIAYPISRSFPILVLGWAWLLLGEQPSAQAVTGVVLVVVGCFILPMKRFVVGPDGLSIKSYLNRSAAWAVAAAVVCSVLSMIDRVGARSFPAARLRAGLSGIVSEGSLSGQVGQVMLEIVPRVNYVYIQNFTAMLTMLVFVRCSRLKLQPVSRRRAAGAGVIFLVSYSLVMGALATDPVAYVTSFRQVSIVIAAVLSMLVLERHFSWPRLVGVLVVFAGVLLVGLG